MNEVDINKLFKENGVSIILFGLIIVYGIIMFIKYLDSKGKSTENLDSNTNPVYSNNVVHPIMGAKDGAGAEGGVQPSEPLGQNSFAPVSGDNQKISSCSTSSDPSQLLPQDTNSQWSQTNPMGQGNLANVNLLKAGEHIGINTIGGSLKNPNLQLRSEPTVPRSDNTGIWNQSTYEADTMRLPFEINSCSK